MNGMNYEEALKYIHSLERFGIRPGLESICTLCERLGNPQDSLRVIHVAGTNGKGSTCTMLSSVYREAGYNVGLYTSPYVVDFRERIQFNGEMISEKDLCDCLYDVKNQIEYLESTGIQITEFEAVTAVAFLYYSRMNCDIVILETGLGGRFDATNIISSPLASVIVSISMDHTAILGDTIKKIAFEKSGIIKTGCPCICYADIDSAALPVIKTACNEKNSRMIIPDLNELEIIDVCADGSEFIYKGEKYSLSLAGKHMIYNSLSVIECVREITTFNVSRNDIVNGLEKAGIPARLEKICDRPVIILDGGHNEGCAVAVRDFLDSNYPSQNIIVVCAMMSDKDYVSYLSHVASACSSFIATTIPMSRALDSDSLCESARKYCCNCVSISDASQAVDEALRQCKTDDVILVCGSFYFISDVRNKLLKFKGDNND